MRARHRTAQKGLHRAPLFFAGRQVNGGINGPGHAHDNDEVGQDHPQDVAADLSWGGHVGLPDVEGREQLGRQIPPGQPFGDNLVPPRPEELVERLRGDGGFEFAFVGVDRHGRRLAGLHGGIEVGRNADGGVDFLVGNEVGEILAGRDEGKGLERAQRRHRAWRICAAQHHDFGDFLAHLAAQFHGGQPKTRHEQRHHEHGHDNHGNNRAPVPEQIAQFLAIDDAGEAAAHGVSSTTRTKMSSRSEQPKRSRNCSRLPSAMIRPR